MFFENAIQNSSSSVFSFGAPRVFSLVFKVEFPAFSIRACCPLAVERPKPIRPNVGAGIKRTNSLDTIAVPYLTGQWPRGDYQFQPPAGPQHTDKTTQVSSMFYIKKKKMSQNLSVLSKHRHRFPKILDIAHSLVLCISVGRVTRWIGGHVCLLLALHVQDLQNSVWPFFFSSPETPSRPTKFELSGMKCCISSV